MQAWNRFLLSLEQELGADTVDRWLKPLVVDRFDAGNLYLKVTSSFQISWFEEHVRPIATKFLTNHNNRPIKVHLITEQLQNRAKLDKVKKRAPKTFELAFDAWNPGYTQANFIVTKHSALAYKLLDQLARAGQYSDPIAFNPIYLYGERGVGKSHLLVATATALKEQGVRVVYCRASRFTDHVVSAIRKGEMGVLRATYRNCDVLIIDDLQDFARKWATQEEFFHTFNTLHTAGKQIILSASCAPSQLKQIESRLISRFEWGVALLLEPLNAPERAELLAIKSRLFEMTLPDKLNEFLTDQFRSTTSLCSALEALLLRQPTNALATLTVDEAKELLADLIAAEEQRDISPEDILRTVAEHFGILAEDLVTRNQENRYVKKRQLAMFLCRKELKMSYPKIGELLSRDHTTAMYGVRSVEEALMQGDREMHSHLTVIKERLTAQ